MAGEVAEEREDGVTVVAPGVGAGLVPGQFERDRGTAEIVAGPTAEATGGRVSDRGLDGVAVVAGEQCGEALAGAVVVVARGLAADRMDRHDGGGLEVLHRSEQNAGFGLAGRPGAVPGPAAPVAGGEVAIEIDAAGVGATPAFETESTVSSGTPDFSAMD